MLKKKLGQKIATLRRQIGMTQEQLAEKSGYSVDFIGLVERGVNAPTVDGLEIVADALRVEVVDLFRFERSKDKKNANTKKQQDLIV